MSKTPRSSTPSRVSTPALIRSSPSRLAIPPVVRPSPSLSNLNIHSHSSASTSKSTLSTDIASIPPVPSPPQTQVLDSSSSSVANLDLNSEGILLQDADADVEVADTEEVMGRVETSAGEESSKKTLRDQLRKTLSQRRSRPDMNSARSRQKRKQLDMDNIPLDPASRYPPREYFILTDAGKPVFTSRADGEDSDNMTSTIGIMQALISVFIDDNDKLRCINAGNTRITFLLRSPLYYVCASSWGEPESVTRSHLEYLHLQILSIVTVSQLRRIFERRTNFDLRRLLNGAETFLTSLLGRLEFDIAINTSSLLCLKLEANLRKRAADALVPTSKMKDVLYVILVARGRVVTLIRPKKHSIHPADIHILLNTIHSPSILNSPASASWIPVCLPKFNPTGFVNAYISFLRKDDGQEFQAQPRSSESESRSGSKPQSPSPQVPEERSGTASKRHKRNDSLNDMGGYSGHELDSGIALVCISGGGEFETIRGWCDTVTRKLESDGILEAIISAFRSGLTEYSVSELGIPGLRHFVYKSRAQVQVTVPMFEDPYDDIQERRRITTLYQILHDAIHAKSGQGGTLKLQYIRTDKESVMAWITQPFELYIALSPLLPKSAAVGAANSVARWVKKEESRLFLRDAPVF